MARCAAAIVCGWMLALGAAAQEEPRVVVISVGVSEYADEEMSLSDAPRESAQWFAETVGGAAGVEPVPLYDGDATLGNLRDTLHEQLSALPSHSTVFLYFAGHGKRRDHPIEIDGMPSSDLYLQLHGASRQSPFSDAMRFDELLLAFKRAPGINAVIFLDCCYASDDPAARVGHASEFDALGSRVVVYAASSGIERAFAGDFRDGLDRAWTTVAQDAVCRTPRQFESVIRQALSGMATRCYLQLGEDTEMCLRDLNAAGGLALLIAGFGGTLHEDLVVLKQNETGGFDEVGRVESRESRRTLAYVRQIRREPAVYRFVHAYDYDQDFEPYQIDTTVTVSADDLEDVLVLKEVSLDAGTVAALTVAGEDAGAVEQREFELAAAIDHGIEGRVIADLARDVAAERFSLSPQPDQSDMLALVKQHDPDRYAQLSLFLPDESRDASARFEFGAISFEGDLASGSGPGAVREVRAQISERVPRAQLEATLASEEWALLLTEAQAFGGNEAVYAMTSAVEPLIESPRARQATLSYGAVSAVLTSRRRQAVEWAEAAIDVPTADSDREALRLARFAMDYSFTRESPDDTVEAQIIWQEQLPYRDRPRARIDARGGR